MRMSLAWAMRQTWMSFSCVPVAMNLPSVLHFSATWLPAQATDMRMQGYPAKVKSLSWSADARWLYTSSQPVFTAWPFAGKGPEGKPPLQFGDEGAGLISVIAAHPAAEFVAAGYDSGELQLGDIKTRRSVVLKMSDGSPVSCLAWSPDGFHLAVGNDNGDMLVVDLRR